MMGTVAMERIKQCGIQEIGRWLRERRRFWNKLITAMEDRSRNTITEKNTKTMARKLDFILRERHVGWQ